MKKLRTTISNWIDMLDTAWQAMPVKKQRRYTLILFAGYAALSLTVMLKVCYDIAKSNNMMTIEHIENPVIKQSKSPVIPQDSLTTILKPIIK